MPLIRSAATVPGAAPPESRDLLLDRLAGGDSGERRHAARALSGDPEAAFALAARLEQEPEQGVRDALFGSLVEIGGMRAAGLVARLVRSEEASLRGGAIEALKRMGEDAVPVLDALLDDPDPDVRILAIEVTRAWPAELAVPRLLHLIEDDPHVNVCGAAVDVATEAGTDELLPGLAALRTRFPDEPFLMFAVDTACSRIQAAGGEKA